MLCFLGQVVKLSAGSPRSPRGAGDVETSCCQRGIGRKAIPISELRQEKLLPNRRKSFFLLIWKWGGFMVVVEERTGSPRAIV